MSERLIFKYAIQLPQARLDLPGNARVLSVGQQNGGLVLWAEVKPENTLFMTVVDVSVSGTGFSPPIQVGPQFVGTVQMPNGLVWHIYAHVGRASTRKGL